MRVEELKDLTLEELRVKKVELSKELSLLKFQHATGQLENPIRIRITRRDIARVETVFNEKKSKGEERPVDGS